MGFGGKNVATSVHLLFELKLKLLQQKKGLKNKFSKSGAHIYLLTISADT